MPRLARDGDQCSIIGELEMVGVKKPLTLTSTVQEDAEGITLRGEIMIKQTDWGIEPFYIMMGAISIKDEIKILWSTRCFKAPAEADMAHRLRPVNTHHQ